MIKNARGNGLRCSAATLLVMAFLLATRWCAAVFGDEAGVPQPPAQTAAPLFKGEITWLRPHAAYAVLAPDWQVLATPVGKEIWLLRATDGHVLRKLPGWTPGSFPIRRS